MLVVPRAEIVQLTEAPDDVLAHLVLVAKTIGQAQQQAWSAPRAALLVAGFEVDHLHLHVLPAWGEAELSFRNARTDVPAAELRRRGRADPRRAARPGPRRPRPGDADALPPSDPPQRPHVRAS